MSKSSEKVIRYRKRIKSKMIEAMGNHCQNCKYDRCADALEFHHVDPNQKEYSFGKLRANPRSKAILVNELKKCILLCSNCHKELHAGLITLPKEYHVFNEEVFYQ